MPTNAGYMPAVTSAPLPYLTAANLFQLLSHSQPSSLWTVADPPQESTSRGAGPAFVETSKIRYLGDWMTQGTKVQLPPSSRIRVQLFTRPSLASGRSNKQDTPSTRHVWFALLRIGSSGNNTFYLELRGILCDHSIPSPRGTLSSCRDLSQPIRTTPSCTFLVCSYESSQVTTTCSVTLLDASALTTEARVQKIGKRLPSPFPSPFKKSTLLLFFYSQETRTVNTQTNRLGFPLPTRAGEFELPSSTFFS
ncbi:hypothetical protein B0H65DRAFT_302456 [Neurospora tetraspora]|uniref:Uncharacterized protein n=1 Tax=Neurospora tetraspora TaxID=94610 RepID=A0AAE0J9P7_9PEZI|nr:hypothetical protein B0H65DRAFT_302456 [Neurospora tetraspora]